MRTLKSKITYDAQLSNALIFDIQVQEHSVSSIFVSDSGGGTLRVYYVFTDDDGTQPVEALIEDVTVPASAGATAVSYAYKTPHIRLRYSSTASTGTVRVNATTAR